MKRFVLVVVLLALTCLAMSAPAFAVGLVKGDVSLTLGPSGQIKLVAAAVDENGVPVATTATITCGTSSRFGSGAVLTDPAATVHKVVLPGVSTPNTRFYYDITLTGNGLTLKLPSAKTRYSFLSPPGPLTNFTIAIFGDTRPNSPGQKEMPPIFGGISKAIAGSGSDLALGVGDYTYIQYWGLVDTRAVIDQRYESFFGVENQIAGAMPTMLAVGNHEALDEPGFPQGFDAWQSWFDFPGYQNRYYSFDWAKNVHVAVLDVSGGPLGFAGDGQPGNSAQAQWLIDDLKANTRPWVFVVFHSPVYDGENGDYWLASPNTSDPAGVAERDRLAAFFVKMGVDATFSGHMHQYRRHMQDGIAYITQGGGGAPLYAVGPGQADTNDAAYYADYGYSTVTFANKGATPTLRSYKVLDASGTQTLGDIYTLKDNPKH